MVNINKTDNLTIGEILRYSLEERKGSRFNSMGVDKDGNSINISEVIIDGVHFTDYKAFSFVWEDSYVKQPERSGSGSIENLNSYAWFLTPHLKIDFSALSIDSYRKLIEMKHSKREFVVTCYDPSYNRMTTNKMYFPPEELPKLLTIARALNGEQWVELLGVQDYSIELIGTNASIDKISVLYYDDTGAIIHSQEVDRGTETIIDFTFTPSKGKFDGTWISEMGTPYKNGSYFFVQTGDDKRSVKFTPHIIDENEYTLSFNYGKGIEPIQIVNAQTVISVPILNGESISTAIARANIQTTNGTFVFPASGTGLAEVEYEFDEEKIKVNGNQVYNFRGWYWTSEENAETKVTGASLFNYNVNRTIYQIYKAIPHTLTYDTGTTEIALGQQSLGYGETVILPRLARNGYSFLGWFLESGNSAPTIMPPVPLKVFAKWEEIK